MKVFKKNKKNSRNRRFRVGRARNTNGRVFQESIKILPNAHQKGGEVDFAGKIEQEWSKVLQETRGPPPDKRLGRKIIPGVPSLPRLQQNMQQPLVRQAQNANCITTSNELILPRAGNLNSQSGWSGSVNNLRPKGRDDVRATVNTVFGIPGAYEHGDPRWTDPFSLMPSNVVVTKTGFTPTLTSIGAGASAYSTTIEIMGDPFESCVHSLTSSTSDGTITYATTGSVVTAGFNSAYMITRPLGVNLRVIPHLYGPEHSISINAVMLSPAILGDFRATHYDCPVLTSDCPSAYAEERGARSWSGLSGQIFTFNCLPIDPNSIMFKKGSISRGAASVWSGWFVWLYGLQVTDRVECYIDYIEEVIPYAGSYTTGPSSTRDSSASVLDWVTQALSSGVDKGLTAWGAVNKLVDWVVRSPVNEIRTMPNGVSLGSGLRAFPPIPAMNVGFEPQAPPALVRDMRRVRADEDEEMKEFDVLRAIQPSRATSLPPSKRLVT